MKNPNAVEIEVSNVNPLSNSLTKAINIGVAMMMNAAAPMGSYFACTHALMCKNDIVIEESVRIIKIVILIYVCKYKDDYVIQTKTNMYKKT